MMYTAKVIAHARRVPCGIAMLGFLRSPEILAPAAEREGGREGGRERGRENKTNKQRTRLYHVEYTCSRRL